MEFFLNFASVQVFAYVSKYQSPLSRPKCQTTLFPRNEQTESSGDPRSPTLTSSKGVGRINSRNTEGSGQPALHTAFHIGYLRGQLRSWSSHQPGKAYLA